MHHVTCTLGLSSHVASCMISSDAQKYAAKKLLGWGFRPNTQLITCRPSKEHQDLKPAGECKGSKYVRTCSHLINPMFLEERQVISRVFETPLPYLTHTSAQAIQTTRSYKQ